MIGLDGSRMRGIWLSLLMSVLVCLLLPRPQRFTIQAQVINSFTKYPTASDYFAKDIPILKALAQSYYLEGVRTLAAKPGPAMEKLINSYKTYPSVYSYELLRWSYSMIGQPNAFENHPHFLPLTEKIRKQRAFYMQQCDLGAQEISAGNYQSAIAYFESILFYDVDKRTEANSMGSKDRKVHLELFEVYFNLAVAYRQLGQMEKAVDYNLHAIHLNPIHSKSILNIATIFQQNGVLEEAKKWYLRGINIHRAFKEVIDTLGYSFLPDDYLKFSSNLILTYFQMQDFNQAFNLAMEIKDELQKFKTQTLLNNPNANIDELNSFIQFNTGIILLLQRNLLNFADFEELWDAALKATMFNKLALCTHFQQHFISPIAQGNNVLDKNAFSINQFQYGPLLPFDTLSHPIPLHQRLLVAEGTSIHNYLKFLQYQLQSQGIFAQRLQQELLDLQHSTVKVRKVKKLKIALMSFDFNNHPTTHLIEGLFRLIHDMRQGDSVEAAFYRDNIELHVISYGVDDQSYYREMLVQYADAFHNILALSFEDAMKYIRDQLQIDVLLDMQIHTLGHRLEIVAMKPAPIQVNYLVFPGTSGAVFFDYIVADAVVIPVEHAAHFSEKLLYLPATYQISYYNLTTDPLLNSVKQLLQIPSLAASLLSKAAMTKRLVQEITTTKIALRRQFGLPVDGIIFCNFNKLDKLEPQSFSVWMEVLRSVPNSYLWLLRPSKHHDEDDLGRKNSSTQILHNILNLVKFHGVSIHRVIFASRVDKALHIQRHAAADLFLDTFFYGAHSTATDAMRGGLPVLTVQGGSFPERVPSSLYQSLAEGSSRMSTRVNGQETDAWNLNQDAVMLQRTLVTFSIKDYVSTALSLSKLQRGKKLNVLKSILWRCVAAERGPFNALEHNRKLLTSISALEDEKILNEGILSTITPTDTATPAARGKDDEFLFQQSPLFASHRRWNLVVSNV